jgi:CheY-like chemotaxis protein
MPHIWIIEDNAAFRRGTERALTMKPHQHDVRAFANCEDAISALDAEEAPQVILLDVGLPGMDGIEGIAHL